jgi:predicted transcriptional regulator of viral defense system
MNKQTVRLTDALQKKMLSDYDKPVISYYSLVKMVAELYRNKSYDNLPIGKISTDYPSKGVIERNIEALVTRGVLSEIPHYPVYAVSGRTAPSAQQIICVLNPFSYLSYLSAMEWHNLTDRIPKAIYITTCTQSKFRQLAKVLAEQDFPNTPHLPGVPAKHHKLSKKLNDKIIHEHTSNKFQMKKELYNTGGIRVSSIGETFLDMLRHPEYCGGVNHILDVFAEHAQQYLPVIVRTINKQGVSIDKVRAGYLLEEKLKLKHPDFDEWKKHAQRGGSRKFIASSPYKNHYSSTWCISLNF